jgi:hypothetical protein
MPWAGAFSRWLRARSEHYLMLAAQRDMATKYHINPPHTPHGTQALWIRLYVPVYRALPWRLRNFVIQQMPGSHRMPWTKPTRARGPAV